jgi:lipopolysaccharide export system ATP-binding protein
MAVLEIKDLHVSIGDKEILKGVNLKTGPGEVHAIMGPNGSGKSSCFYSIAGLVNSDMGSVIIDGRDATHLPMYRRARLGIGYLPQEMSIFRGMTVADNILAVLEITIKDRRDRMDKLEELLSEFSNTAKILSATVKHKNIDIS